MKNMSGQALLLAMASVMTACHHVPPSTGPHDARTAAECAPVIAQVRSDSAMRATLRASQRTMSLPPLPAPPRARGQTATLWVPVDERGRVRMGDVRVTGMPDPEYALELQRFAAKAMWAPAVRDDCWVPGWGYMTLTFSR